jgi:predicted nucleotidyltransferase/DNA-binding transcriptional ArsR family regulator
MGGSTIATSLFPKARQAVLALLLGHPDERFYLRQVVELTGLGVGHVQRELARLAGAGIIRRSREGRHVYFQADAACPIHRELRGIVIKTMGAAELLRQALSPLRDRIRAAFIYGSVARGQERTDSDIDVMVVGRVGFAEVVEVIRDAERSLGRPVNATVYPEGELTAKIRDDHHFLNQVLASEKLMLIGGDDELAAISGQ